MEEIHVPVLLKESKNYLINNKSGVYFDATLGFGGHSQEFLKELNEDAKLVAAEVDDKAFEYCSLKFENEKRFKIYKTNFSQIDLISKIENVEAYDGIFADLGVSSFQLDDADAGFSYRVESPLDLRLDKSLKVKASDIINGFTEEEIADLIYEFGEEKNSRKIARKIVENRKIKKIKTTKDLAEIIEKITPEKYLNKTLSRVFQAFRIYVNNELGVLEEFLTKAVTLLKPGANIVIIAYHSLEDRIVKDVFKYETVPCVCPKDFPVCTCGKKQRLKIITKKPVLPDENEILINRRARSAKLRVAERI